MIELEVRAGYSGVWINTLEPEEAIEDIAKLCQEKDWTCINWSPVEAYKLWPSPGDPVDGVTKDVFSVLRTQPFREFDGPCVVLLNNLHRLLKNAPASLLQAFQDVLYRGKACGVCFVVLAPDTSLLPSELSRKLKIKSHPLPTLPELESIASDILENIEEEKEREKAYSFHAIRASRGLTRSEAQNIFALSMASKKALDPELVWEHRADAFRQKQILSIHQGSGGFRDIGGLDQLKHFSKTILTSPSTVARKGLMLVGPPGTGKSAFAKALGNETSLPTVILDPAGAFHKHVGETESQIREALQAIDSIGPCVVMIDEIEKALSGLGSDGDSGVSSRMFGTILTWLSDREERKSEAFVIATCNNLQKLPPEMSRSERFDGIFFLDLPTKEEKDIIWNLYREQFETKGALPNDTNWTGAEIRSCCRLSNLMSCTLTEASELVIPVAETRKEEIQMSREMAQGRYLSATEPGKYLLPKDRIEKRRRKINLT